MRVLFILINLSVFVCHIRAQKDTCITRCQVCSISSDYLQEDRPIWVSLPTDYDSNATYPVIYVMEAEWRFELVRCMVRELEKQRNTQKHIIVGVTNNGDLDKRSRQLTFSVSENDHLGNINKRRFKPENSGDGDKFYKFLTDELMPFINETYATNAVDYFIGHSYAALFGAHLLAMHHSFEGFILADPSIWYSRGDVLDKISSTHIDERPILFVANQSKPDYHNKMVKQFIDVLQQKSFVLHYENYEDKSHGGMFMPALMHGLNFVIFK